MDLLELKAFLEKNPFVSLQELSKRFEVKEPSLLKYWVDVLNRVYGMHFHFEKQGYRLVSDGCEKGCAACHSKSCHLT